jgi:Gly-Xaa carboxypeptidase
LILPSVLVRFSVLTLSRFRLPQVAQYEALSILLADPSYVPRRSIILSHGFDEEEVFARQGAGTLAPFLEARYGKDSMLLVIDEGTSMDNNAWGAEFAVPSSSEKVSSTDESTENGR